MFMEMSKLIYWQKWVETCTQQPTATVQATAGDRGGCVGLGPMEDPAQELTSGDDSGGSGMSEPNTETSPKGCSCDRTVMVFPRMSVTVTGRAGGGGGGQRHCECGTRTVVRMPVTTDGGRAGG